jgi:hypothetical protein
VSANQIFGFFDTTLPQPLTLRPNKVEEKKNQIQGRKQMQRQSVDGAGTDSSDG